MYNTNDQGLIKIRDAFYRVERKDGVLIMTDGRCTEFYGCGISNESNFFDMANVEFEISVLENDITDVVGYLRGTYFDFQVKYSYEVVDVEISYDDIIDGPGQSGHKKDVNLVIDSFWYVPFKDCKTQFDPVYIEQCLRDEICKKEGVDF